MRKARKSTKSRECRVDEVTHGPRIYSFINPMPPINLAVFKQAHSFSPVDKLFSTIGGGVPSYCSMALPPSGLNNHKFFIEFPLILLRGTSVRSHKFAGGRVVQLLFLFKLYFRRLPHNLLGSFQCNDTHTTNGLNEYPCGLTHDRFMNVSQTFILRKASETTSWFS